MNFKVFVVRRSQTLLMWLRMEKIILNEYYTETLRRKGIVRRPAETTMEFAKRCGDKNIHTITKAFEKLRYGHKELTRVEKDEVETALTELRVSAKWSGHR